MKIIKPTIVWIALAMPWIMLSGVRAADVSVGVEINSPDDFTGPLSANGTWVEVGSYGRCWHPYGVDATWRPYCDGTWVSTDQGWYWQSDEPWSWACYHYGRWAQDPYYGWVWAPDTTWGPSWVCFREGGGYCGWAPLPPGAVFAGNGELVIGAVPNDWFVFIGERHFGERVNRRDVIINNVTIINRTTINTKIRRENNRVIAEGPRVQDLQKVNHTRIQTGNVQTLRQHEKAPPITHRAAPQQPVIQHENEKPVERPAVEPQREAPRETTPRKQPEIIRGPPSAPEPPPVDRQQRNEPLPVERPPQHNEAPAERHAPAEPRPAEPPHGEKVAPQKAPPAPAHEEPRGDGGQGGHEDGGHGGEKDGK